MTLVYECDGEETKFTRSIKKDGVGEYRIDGKVCKWEAYSARLKSLGVLTQARARPLPPSARRGAPRARPARGPARACLAALRRRVRPPPRPPRCRARALLLGRRTRAS